jgi:RND family efflux transporter MFP subunit
MMTTSQNTFKKNNKKRMVPISYVVTPITIISVAIIFVILAALFAQKPTKKPLLTKAPLVETIVLAPQTTRFVVQSQGTVQPRTETTLVSEVSGAVIDVAEKFLVGGFFKQGEWILTIDDAIYQINLTKAKARLATAKANLLEEQGRAEQAKQEWLLTGKSLNDAPALALRLPQVAKAEADVVAAKADVAEAQIRLAKTKIVAPYDAMIKEKRTDIGQYVSAGSQLAVTFAVDYVEVRLPIKARDLNFLNTGRINHPLKTLDSVELYAYIDQQKQIWRSHIDRFEGFVDSKNRVYYAITQIADPYNLKGKQPQAELQVGRFMRANILGKSLPAVYAIPRSAVSGNNTLYLLTKDNKLAIINFTVLRSDADYIYSQDQQLAEQRIVITKLETPVAGMTLRVATTTKQNEKPAQVKKVTLSKINGQGEQ